MRNTSTTTNGQWSYKCKNCNNHTRFDDTAFYIHVMIIGTGCVATMCRTTGTEKGIKECKIESAQSVENVKLSGKWNMVQSKENYRP